MSRLTFKKETSWNGNKNGFVMVEKRKSDSTFLAKNNYIFKK